MSWVVGITGSIGSGKTTACDFFSKLGVPIIYTDKIAKKLTIPGTKAYAAIIKRYGVAIQTPDGQIDRGELRKIIFANKKEQIWLEQLLNPKIHAKVKELINQTKAPYCIVEIPLLVGSKLLPIFDKILVIDCDESLQIERAMQRDNCTQELILQILKAQPPSKLRNELADDLISNTQDLSYLNKEVIKLHAQYLQDCNHNNKNSQASN